MWIREEEESKGFNLGLLTFVALHYFEDITMCVHSFNSMNNCEIMHFC